MSEEICLSGPLIKALNAHLRLACEGGLPLRQPRPQPRHLIAHGGNVSGRLFKAPLAFRLPLRRLQHQRTFHWLSETAAAAGSCAPGPEGVSLSGSGHAVAADEMNKSIVLEHLRTCCSWACASLSRCASAALSDFTFCVPQYAARASACAVARRPLARHSAAAASRCVSCSTIHPSAGNAILLPSRI